MIFFNLWAIQKLRCQAILGWGLTKCTGWGTKIDLPLLQLEGGNFSVPPCNCITLDRKLVNKGEGDPQNFANVVYECPPWSDWIENLKLDYTHGSLERLVRGLEGQSKETTIDSRGIRILEFQWKPQNSFISLV